MTLGDIIQGIRTGLGGKSKDEQELEKMKDDLRKMQGNLQKMQDKVKVERRNKDALAELIKEKQAELAATTLKQNQISIAKEIMGLKDNLDEVQKTEDGIVDNIEALIALINAQERKIIAKQSGVSVDDIVIATDEAEVRRKKAEEIKSAKEKLKRSGNTSRGDEDYNKLIANAGASIDSAPVKPAAPKVNPAEDAIIAAASESIDGAMPSAADSRVTASN